jgi:hypothetical protein
MIGRARTGNTIVLKMGYDKDARIVKKKSHNDLTLLVVCVIDHEKGYA